MVMFRNLVKSFGVRGGDFAELWSLDNNYICSFVSNYRNVYGLVFFFKW